MDKIKSLKKLLDPKKIAVIGASRSEDKVGGIVFKRLLNSRRRLFPVNPKEIVIQGYKVTPDINSLPEDIDLAIITISAKACVKAVEMCIDKNIQHYIIVAGGFAEVGGTGIELENSLKQLAKKHSINILGPNSLGIFLPDENIDTIFVEHGDQALDRNGQVACIVQSGSVGVEALGYAANTGFGMRAFVGLGNKCDLDEIDFLQYFAQDKKTNCIGFYLENIERGREFLELAKEVAKDKPVVVLKAGRTKTAINAVSSHTGKLAGSDNVINGAFKQFGIQRVYDDEEFCDATKVLSMLKEAPGNRVAVLTAAGGYGVICTDFIEKKDNRAALTMAKLSENTKKQIKDATFSFTACENPVDITASADDLMFSLSLDALIADDGVDIIICIAFFAPPGITENLIDIIAEKIKQSSKPVIVFTKYGPFTDNSIKNLFYAKVAAYPSVGRAVRAARFLVERTRIGQQFENMLQNEHLPAFCVDHKIKDNLKSWLDTLAEKNGTDNSGNNDPDEFDAKKLVNLYSIKVPAGKRFGFSGKLSNEKLDIDQLDSANINPPYVLKVCSPKILHKTELQGVLLNSDKGSIKDNFEKMQKRFPNENILVENQTDFMGPEFIIGIIKDPALGHAIMVGAGGVLTEIYKDTSFRLAPCSVDQAMEMIDELALSPIFDDFRGITLDKLKFAKTISQVSELANDLGDKLSQLDINPIVYSNGEWIALDVKIMFE
jgi:acetate---CoA ligase (ADP-forming)